MERAIELASRHGKLVFLNPAPYTQLPNGLLSKVDYLIPNETEAKALLGLPSLDESNVADALKALVELGVRYPVITMGEKGAAYYVDGECYVDPCCKVEPVDSTAAGDTFIGAMASALLRGRSIHEAVPFAQRAAAYCVSHRGAHTSIPTLHDIEC